MKFFTFLALLLPCGVYATDYSLCAKFINEKFRLGYALQIDNNGQVKENKEQIKGFVLSNFTKTYTKMSNSKIVVQYDEHGNLSSIRDNNPSENKNIVAIEYTFETISDKCIPVSEVAIKRENRKETKHINFNFHLCKSAQQILDTSRDENTKKKGLASLLKEHQIQIKPESDEFKEIGLRLQRCEQAGLADRYKEKDRSPVIPVRFQPGRVIN